MSSGGPRVIVETDEWLAVVPFWAAWPFETLLIPKRPAARLTDLDDAARDDLAVVLARADRPLRRAVQAAVPVFDGLAPGAVRRRGRRPTPGRSTRHFYPPLLRANVRKFMVGYELLAETQRDLTAEDAAGRLRAVVAGRESSAGAGPAAGSRRPARRGPFLTNAHHASARHRVAMPAATSRCERPDGRREPRPGTVPDAGRCRVGHLGQDPTARASAERLTGTGARARVAWSLHTDGGTMRTWGGRFSGDTDARVAASPARSTIDAALAADDIAGSIAHVRGLGRAGHPDRRRGRDARRRPRRARRRRRRRTASPGTRRSRTST